MTSESPNWRTETGDGPLVACAIHDGHAVRPEVTECLRLDSAQRRYEEDPYTAPWTSIARPGLSLCGRDSRSISIARGIRRYTSHRPMPGGSRSGGARLRPN